MDNYFKRTAEGIAMIGFSDLTETIYFYSYIHYIVVSKKKTKLPLKSGIKANRDSISTNEKVECFLSIYSAFDKEFYFDPDTKNYILLTEF